MADQPNVKSYTEPHERLSLVDAVERLGIGRFQHKVVAFIGLLWTAYAMIMMILTVLGPILQCELDVSPVQQALVTTALFVGYAVGSQFFGWFSNTYGTKKALLMMSVWAGVYSMLMAAAPSYPWVVVLRFLVGVGVGGMPQAINYATDFLPKSIGDQFVLVLSVFWAIGVLTVTALACMLLDGAGWRWWIVACTVPYFIMIPFICMLPEMPSYLLTRGRGAEARRILDWAAAENSVFLPPGPLLAQNTQLNTSHQLKMLFNPDNLKVTVKLAIAWIAINFSYYGASLFTTELITAPTSCIQDMKAASSLAASCRAGCHSLTHDEFIQIMWTSAAEIPGVMLMGLFVTRTGARPATVLCCLVFSASCLLLFICGDKTLQIGLLFMGRGFITAAAQLLYMMTKHVYPSGLQSVSMGFMGFVSRPGPLVTPFVAEVLIAESPMATLSVYAAVTLIAALLLSNLPTRDMEPVKMA